jgi:hypothetical protein
MPDAQTPKQLLSPTLTTFTNANMQSSRPPLPAVTWLSNFLKSDLHHLTRPRGGASLAHDADELVAELMAERAARDLAALHHPPPPPATPGPQQKGPARKATDWPMSFPGPHPVSGEQNIVKDGS